MKSHIDDDACAASVQASRDTSRNFLELLGYILADGEGDIRTAARDFALSDASLVRLRRAMDRVACAQRLVETVRAVAGGGTGAPTAESSGDSQAEDSLRVISAAMRAEVELLAKGWPEDYPAGAVEWLLL
ncbi:hypothetical protein LMG28138_00813 [Pararobbsia alpina]|uniref:Uncharacterized protein n=1 Tax=Pararobbsia alpina TaxID=621374 RepID=A0A6S7C211_9BURK|nr:hypothetical protein LMG28138_00813 [Pararobbsia alpina]